MKSKAARAIIAGQIEELFVVAGLNNRCYSANNIGKYLNLLVTFPEAEEDQDDEPEGVTAEEGPQPNPSILRRCLKFNRLMKIMLADSPEEVMEALLEAKDVSDIQLFNFCVMMALVRLHQLLTIAQKRDSEEDVASTSGLITPNNYRRARYALWRSPALTTRSSIAGGPPMADPKT